MLQLEALEGRLAPAFLTVNTLVDETTADNVLSLREAVAAVDAGSTSGLSTAERALVSGTLGSKDTIQFDPNLPVGTIKLTGGALNITRSVSITGPGAANLTISGNNADRVFLIGQGPTVTLSGLTVTGGKASSGGGGIFNQGALTVNGCAFTSNTAAGNGGGLNTSSAGTLAVYNSTFTGNTTTGSYSYGGGLINSSTATSNVVSNSTFSGNSASGSGGGLFNDTGATLTVSNSTFSGNKSSHDGGGVDHDGKSLTLTDCTFTGNTAASDGGGLQNFQGTLSLRNSTFTGNTAAYGGGLTIAGPATVVNITVTANRATSSSSGGLYYYNTTASGPVYNTIVAGNFMGSTPGDISGTLDSRSAYNLIGTGGSGGLRNGVNGNQVGVSNPGLGSLANNGGPTQTVALLPGSPAINHGSNTYVNAGETDQRSFTRIVNGTVDIGAFEVQTVVQGQGSFRVTGFPSPTTAGVAGSFTVTALDANGITATGYTGTVHFTSSDGQALLPANYIFTSNDAGSHTFSATLMTAGSQSITATDTASSTITGSQTGITVNPAGVQPPIITSASANPNPVTGKTTTLTATATDPNGVGGLIYTWSLVSGPPAGVTFGSNNGTTSGNNVTATFSMAGSYTFQVTVTDSFGVSSTQNVNVTVQQTLTSVTVSPATASIPVKGKVQFTATALDQFGNPLAAQPGISWAIVSGPGRITGNGLYTGTTIGSAVIQATVKGTTISGTATVTAQ